MMVLQSAEWTKKKQKILLLTRPRQNWIYLHGGSKIAEAEQVEEEDVIGDILQKLPQSLLLPYTQADRDP